MEGVLAEPLQLYAAGYYKAAATAAAAIRAVTTTAADTWVEQQRAFLQAACEQQLLLLQQQPWQLQQQQHHQQLQQMRQSANPAIKALGLFLLLTKYADPVQNPQQQLQMRQELLDLGQSNVSAAFLAASAAAETDPLFALQICSAYNGDHQMRALRLQLLLRINREDVAKTQVEGDTATGAYETAEQSISRALCHIWNGEFLPGDHCLSDAEISLPRRGEELSPLIENGRAVSLIQRGDYQSAYQQLSNLLRQAPWDEVCLTNSLACLRLLRRHQEADQLSDKLCRELPDCHAAKQRQRLREVFAAEAATDVPL